MKKNSSPVSLFKTLCPLCLRCLLFRSFSKLHLSKKSVTMKPCYCGLGKEYEQCCEPILKDQKKAQTAEALMRSRYTAYTIADIPYLVQSTHPSQRHFYSATDLKRWALSSKWVRLEILSTEMGKASDTKGFVEFKAYFVDEDLVPQIHHEYSTFSKENGVWYFLKGELKTN